MRKALGPEDEVQLIAVDDIGHASADAFDDPDRYVGAVVELAGDSLTFGEIDATLRRHELVIPHIIPGPVLPMVGWLNADLRHNFEFIEKGGWRIDINSQRQTRPWLTTFDQWSHRRASPTRG